MPTFSLQQKHADLDHHNANLLIRIAHETNDVPIHVKILSLLGDERQLRGIPAIGRGVTGAMTNTIPGQWNTTTFAPRSTTR